MCAFVHKCGYNSHYYSTSGSTKIEQTQLFKNILPSYALIDVKKRRGSPCSLLSIRKASLLPDQFPLFLLYDHCSSAGPPTLIHEGEFSNWQNYKIKKDSDDGFVNKNERKESLKFIGKFRMASSFFLLFPGACQLLIVPDPLFLKKSLSSKWKAAVVCQTLHN